MIFYYGLFNSLATYGIIGWGGAYNNVLRRLLNIQKRLFKIIFGKNYKTIDTLPLNIKQTYQCIAAVEHFYENQTNFFASTIQTRKKTVNISRRKKKHATKSSEYIANKVFNMLPLELKTMTVSKKTKKKKLSKWFKANTVI